MIGVIFVTNYTANLVSFLAVVRKEHSISSFDELTEQNDIHYGTLHNTIITSRFETSTIPSYKRAWKHSRKYETNVVSVV